MIDINFPILCAQIVTFLLAVTALWKLAWGPLCALLTERSQNIKNAILAAEQAKENVAKLQEEYRVQLGAIQEKAQELIEEARKAGAKEREEIIRRAGLDAQDLVEKTRNQLSLDKERLVQELRQEVSGLSVEIARKLLKECMNKELEDRMFQESLRQIESIKKSRV